MSFLVLGSSTFKRYSEQLRKEAGQIWQINQLVNLNTSRLNGSPRYWLDDFSIMSDDTDTINTPSSSSCLTETITDHRKL